MIAMPDAESLLQNVGALTPFTVLLVALAGVVVGIAPSSFPLLTVAAGLAAGREAAAPDRTSVAHGLRLAAGFALGIASVDAVLGALFGFAGYAVLHVPGAILAPAYAVLGVALLVAGLALLRLIRVKLPVLAPSEKPLRSFLGSYALGLPFGLSTCPACTPLVLPVVVAAASTASPLTGAVLLFAFGVARGIPITLAGTATAAFARVRRTRRFLMLIERIGGLLTLAAALYFLYRAAIYAGWLPPG